MIASATHGDQAASPVAGYVSVQVHTLRSISTAAVDLYVQYAPHSEPLLYCRAGWPLEAEHFIELQKAGVEQLYIRSGDFCNFSNDLLESLESLLQQEAIPQTERFAALQLAFAVEIEHTLRLVDCGKYHTLAEKVGHKLVALLAGGDILPRELFRIARHDFNTFTHVTNVASYSVILAEHMGLSDRGELEQIATAAILHDVGKRFIPARILTKPGRLDPEEREIVETHPLRGYVELCQRSGLEFGQLMMVYQHHERVDGTGYPVRILRDEIHPWARMLTVVDVFDAMTARRPYRRHATLRDVLDYQRKHAGTHFDPEVVECWTSAMTQA
jgi:HD-GYP domain-containing protein (c-di-GMP phosphodiesterase class II)